MSTTNNAMINTMNNAISTNNAKDKDVESKKYCFKTPYDFDVNNDSNEKENWEDEIYND